MSSRSVSRSPAALARCRVGLSVGLMFSAAAAISACSDENTKLMVTGLDPDKGDVQGETYVHIHGNRFTADGPRTAKIYFGGHRGQVIRFVSDSDMIVQPPGGKTGETVDVVIEFDPGGLLKIPAAFHYVERKQNMPSVNDLAPSKDGK